MDIKKHIHGRIEYYQNIRKVSLDLATKAWEAEAVSKYQFHLQQHNEAKAVLIELYQILDLLK